MTERVMVRVEKELLDKIKENFPETKRLTYSATVDVMLRKILNMEVKAK